MPWILRQFIGESPGMKSVVLHAPVQHLGCLRVHPAKVVVMLYDYDLRQQQGPVSLGEDANSEVHVVVSSDPGVVAPDLLCDGAPHKKDRRRVRHVKRQHPEVLLLVAVFRLTASSLPDEKSRTSSHA